MDSPDDLSPAQALGRAVATRRTALGLKRKDLAKAAELSYPYISEIENGGKEPSAKALRRIAEALDLSVAELTSIRERFDDEPVRADRDDSSADFVAFAVQASSDAPPPPMAPGPEDVPAMVRRLVRAELDEWAATRLPELIRRELRRADEGGSER